MVKKSFLNYLYDNALIKKLFSLPSTNKFERSHQITVLIYIGVSFALCMLIIMLTISILFLKNNYLISRLGLGLGVLIYQFVLLVLLRRSHFKIVSWGLMLIFGLIAYFVLVTWGINAPIGILTLAFIIFLSSVMLGVNYIIPVTAIVISLLFFIQSLSFLELINPDSSVLATPSTVGDAASYATIFGVYALIAWVAGNQRESALKRAHEAELSLQNERDLLEVRLEERTRSLRKAKLEETHQLYRFAELGQLTTVILHELANNLSVLNLDIDDLKQRHKNSSSLTRAQESIRYLDAIVDKVRIQSTMHSESIRFNAVKAVVEAVETLDAKITRENVRIKIIKPKKTHTFYTFGDPLRFSQTILILLNNAIDAYKKIPSMITPTIIITLQSTLVKLTVTVADNGPGIPKDMHAGLFKPLNSSKQNGLGIGLFIAREIIETTFNGSLTFQPKLKSTEFVIVIPAIHKKK